MLLLLLLLLLNLLALFFFFLFRFVPEKKKQVIGIGGVGGTHERGGGFSGRTLQVMLTPELSPLHAGHTQERKRAYRHLRQRPSKGKIVDPSLPLFLIHHHHSTLLPAAVMQQKRKKKTAKKNISTGLYKLEIKAQEGGRG